MDDDDSTTLEGSLFYSCMSSATALDERGAAEVENAGEGRRRKGKIGENAGEGEGREKTADPSPSSSRRQGRQSKAATAPAPRGGNRATSGGDARAGKATSGGDARASRPTSNGDARAGKPTNGDARGAGMAPSSPSGDSAWSVLSERERPAVRSMTFNRDRTCLVASTTLGVTIRSLDSLRPPVRDPRADGGEWGGWTHDVPLPPDGATCAQLLHETSLLAVVRPSSPRCCMLYNARRAESPLAALPLSAAVKRVELQRRVLAAMTVDLRLHVFHLAGDGDGRRDASAEKKIIRPTLITTLNIMHPSDSPRNVRGMEGFNAGSYFDLSSNEEEPYLVCKSFNGSPGTVRVYNPTIICPMADVVSCNASAGSGSATSTASSWDKQNPPPAAKRVKRRIHFLSSIDAHDHAVTRMLIGGGGQERQTHLATASSKGTTIRVFGLPKGDHLWEWHRGSRPCQFHSLSWNGAADRLASYGSSGTIHVFGREKRRQPPDVWASAEGDSVDDGGDFQRVHDGAPLRVLDGAAAGGEKPLLRRIGSSIRRRAVDASKHGSMAKLKYRPSPQADAAASSSDPGARPPPLVLALLDRDRGGGGRGTDEREDALVFMTADGELRRHCVGGDGSVGLIRVEDALARR